MLRVDITKETRLTSWEFPDVWGETKAWVPVLNRLRALKRDYALTQELIR